MERDFSHNFTLIYQKYCDIQRKNLSNPSVMGFGRFLGHGHDGKVKAWKKGQWPSAEDCWILERLLGFNLRWLITGEGDPFGKGGKLPGADAASQRAEEERCRIEERLKELEQQNAALEKELREADRVNRQLTTRLFVDGAGDKGAQTATGKTADGAK